MKYLLLIAVAFGGYKFYESQSVPSYKSWFEIVNKVEQDGATLKEVKFGAHLLAKQLCNDEGFQEQGGSTVKSCNDMYKEKSPACESLVFDGAPENFSLKKNVSSLAKEFITCVGIS